MWLPELHILNMYTSVNKNKSLLLEKDTMDYLICSWSSLLKRKSELLFPFLGEKSLYLQIKFFFFPDIFIQAFINKYLLRTENLSRTRQEAETRWWANTNMIPSLTEYGAERGR